MATQHVRIPIELLPQVRRLIADWRTQKQIEKDLNRQGKAA